MEHSLDDLQRQRRTRNGAGITSSIPNSVSAKAGSGYDLPCLMRVANRTGGFGRLIIRCWMRLVYVAPYNGAPKGIYWRRCPSVSTRPYPPACLRFPSNWNRRCLYLFACKKPGYRCPIYLPTVPLHEQLLRTGKSVYSACIFGAISIIPPITSRWGSVAACSHFYYVGADYFYVVMKGHQRHRQFCSCGASFPNLPSNQGHSCWAL